MSNVPDARARILDAASRIFAEKSFEGSRINDIAKTANVPNSLIYYHFKSKEDILDNLLNDLLAEYSQLLQIAKNDIHSDKPNTIAGRLDSHYAEFISKNIDLIRIIIFESLKKNVEKPHIFKIAEKLVENDSETIKTSSSYNPNERMMAEFFTCLAPICLFQCFQKQWCDYFNMDQREYNQLFTTLITETHGAYHKNHD